MSDLQAWVDALEAELNLEPGTVDITAMLDLARDAAHVITRPAAPVTTYAVGYAAGLAAAAGTPSDASQKASALVIQWKQGG